MIQTKKAAMHTFRFLNQRRRVRLALAVCNGGDRVPGVRQCRRAERNGARQQSHVCRIHQRGPTYLRDIQPIFMGNCSRCHNQQSRFVYDWLDYKTAYADRWEIKKADMGQLEGRLLQGGHAGGQQPRITGAHRRGTDDDPELGG